jgi:phage tail-like protein
VTIDGQDLGSWATCKGLEVDFQHETYTELGNNQFIHYLPRAAKYTHITLERACTAEESTALQRWLSKVAMQPSKGTASITLHDAHQGDVITWTLTDVFPAKWTGPQLDAGVNKMAMETLVLAHAGFLD